MEFSPGGGGSKEFGKVALEEVVARRITWVLKSDVSYREIDKDVVDGYRNEVLV